MQEECKWVKVMDSDKRVSEPGSQLIRNDKAQALFFTSWVFKQSQFKLELEYKIEKGKKKKNREFKFGKVIWHTHTHMYVYITNNENSNIY